MVDHSPPLMKSKFFQSWLKLCSISYSLPTTSWFLLLSTLLCWMQNFLQLLPFSLLSAWISAESDSCGQVTKNGGLLLAVSSWGCDPGTFNGSSRYRTPQKCMVQGGLIIHWSINSFELCPLSLGLNNLCSWNSKLFPFLKPFELYSCLWKTPPVIYLRSKKAD